MTEDMNNHYQLDLIYEDSDEEEEIEEGMVFETYDEANKEIVHIQNLKDIKENKIRLNFWEARDDCWDIREIEVWNYCKYWKVWELEGGNKCYEEDDNNMVCCSECDYTIDKNAFDEGKGRIMWSAGHGIVCGKYRCEECDPRIPHWAE